MSMKFYSFSSYTWPDSNFLDHFKYAWVFNCNCSGVLVYNFPPIGIMSAFTGVQTWMHSDSKLSACALVSCFVVLAVCYVLFPHPQLGISQSRLRRGTSSEKMPPSEFQQASHCGIFLINDSCGRATSQHTKGDTTSAQMILGGIRKKTGETMASKPVRSPPPWSLLQLLPPGSCLEPLVGFPQ